MSDSPGRLAVRVDGPAGWITFDNQARRNAISPDMYASLPAVLEQLDNDPAVRVIVITGAGEKAFISGADLSAYAAIENAGQLAAMEVTMETARERLYHVRKPTIAMIRGFCIGGGLEIAVACDFRIGSDDVRMGLPVAKLGRGYDWNGVRKLINLIGLAYAKDILLTGRLVNAAEAFHMGLLGKVVHSAELESATGEYVTMLAENAPLSLETLKAIAHELVKPGPQVDLARCEAMSRRCTESNDFIEGPRAFVEKRKPIYTGT